MFKFNLTTLIMFVALMWVVAFGISKWQDARSYKKAYQAKLSEVTVWENEVLTEHRAETKVLKDSIVFLKDKLEASKQKANVYRGKVVKLESELTTLGEQVEQIPHDESYAFLYGLNEPVGTLEYPFAGNQVRGLHTNYLEGIWIKEIKKNLEKENEYLLTSMQTSGEMTYAMDREIQMCEEAMAEMGKKFEIGNMENKELKRKVWTNRGIATLGVVFGILVLL